LLAWRNRLADSFENKYASAEMSLQEIEQSALRLPEPDRAKLAAQLLNSLPPVLADEDDGVAEAVRRDAELDADPSQAMTLNDLDARVEQRRRSR
jgi:putative addiction module component (TIGR02574 family)